MHPQHVHADRFLEARIAAKTELMRNVKAAAEAQRFLTRFGVDLNAKKIEGIKYLREKTNIGLAEAKEAWELACELRAA